MAQKREQEIELGMTRLEYGDADRPQRAVLTITTRKYYSGGLISDAVVYWHGKHSKQNCIALGGDGGDYSNRLKIERALTATQRNIDRQHAEVFTPEVIQGLTEGAKAHYARFVRAGVDGFAARMVQLAAVQSGETVLEPSAGTGNIVRAVIEAVIEAAS